MGGRDCSYAAARAAEASEGRREGTGAAASRALRTETAAGSTTVSAAGGRSPGSRVPAAAPLSAPRGSCRGAFLAGADRTGFCSDVKARVCVSASAWSEKYLSSK